MKNLHEFLSEALIHESSAMKDYDIILDHIDFTDVDLTDYDKVFKLVKESIIETKSRFKVLSVTSVEEYNKNHKEWTENEILKALPEQTKKIVDHMKGLKV